MELAALLLHACLDLPHPLPTGSVKNTNKKNHPATKKKNPIVPFSHWTLGKQIFSLARLQKERRWGNGAGGGKKSKGLVWVIQGTSWCSALCWLEGRTHLNISQQPGWGEPIKADGLSDIQPLHLAWQHCAGAPNSLPAPPSAAWNMHHVPQL